MSAEGPPPAAESRWNRAASNQPPKGLVIKVLAVGLVVAIALLGLSAWYVFGELKRAADDYERLAVTAGTIETCDAGERSTESGWMSPASPSTEPGEVPDGVPQTGNCAPYQFRITTVGPVEAP